MRFYFNYYFFGGLSLAFRPKERREGDFFSIANEPVVIVALVENCLWRLALPRDEGRGTSFWGCDMVTLPVCSVG